MDQELIFDLSVLMALFLLWLSVLGIIWRVNGMRKVVETEIMAINVRLGTMDVVRRGEK